MNTHFASIDKESFVKVLEAEDKLLLFQKSSYLFGSLFWHKKNGKTLRVLDWGDCYDSSVIKKWLDQDINLEIKSKINFLWCIEFSKKLDEIIKLSTDTPCEKERQVLFQELGLWLNENCTDEIINQDLITVTHYYFFNLSDNLKKHFFQLPEEIRRRNLLVASHMVVSLILCRYTSFDYLRDVYNTCLLLDYRLSYDMWGQVEKENVLLFYKKNSSQSSFLNDDIQKYHEKTKSELRKILFFKGTADLLDNNYEKLNGLGARKKKEVDISDEDSILLMLINVFKSFDKDSLLEKVWKPYTQMNGFPFRIREFIKQSVGETDDDEYLAVEGL